ncbi:hypothetical protein BDI4_1070016 [Burkholderia diffusa]|nr:hypothetical protein BDI4_1070016 [Burkholderia diffusa]
MHAGKRCASASERFHYSRRNNNKIVRGENSVECNLNELPIREYLVTNFSLIYRFSAAIPGRVAGKGRNNAGGLPGGPHRAPPDGASQHLA